MNRLTLTRNPAELDPAKLDPTELNLLLVTGHPDDEALIGGIAKHNLGRRDRALTVAALSATMGGASTEYRLPAETLPASPGDFEEHLKAVRTEEFYRGVGSLGVRWAMVLDLPDQEVNDILYRHQLTEELAKHAFGLSGFYNDNPWAFVTLGPDGFDGHSDHTATHEATRDASEQLLRRHGLYIPVFGLNAHGNGTYEILLTDELREAKTEVLASHASQMPLTENGELDPIFFEALGDHRKRYEEVLRVKETYDLYPPRIPYLLE